MPYTAQYVIEHYLKTGINTNVLYCATVDNEHVNITSLGIS